MDTQINKNIMARNIRYFMERKGVSNHQLCDALGFKYTTFHDWIMAKTYPRIGKVEAMARYFGCEKSDLIEDKKENPANIDGISEVKRIFIERIMHMSEEQLDRLDQIMKLVENPAPKGKD